MNQVSYSFGMKLSTKQYENATFHVSLTSDIEEGESYDDAFKRAKEWVETKAHKQLVEIRSVYTKDEDDF